jgi:hypothetical protein
MKGLLLARRHFIKKFFPDFHSNVSLQNIISDAVSSPQHLFKIRFSLVKISVVYNIIFVPESIHLLAQRFQNAHKYTHKKRVQRALLICWVMMVLYCMHAVQTDDIISLLVRKERE